MADANAPFWAAPALLAVAVAALGFVGKIIADLVLRLRADARDRKSRLTELYAVLQITPIPSRQPPANPCCG